MIRKGETQRLGWVYEPSWCCRNIPLSVIGLINVSQSGCSHRRPSHLLLSFTLPAYLSLAIRVHQPMNPRVARADVTPGLLTRSCRREPVSQCDGNVGGAGACWVQIDGPDEIEAWRWQESRGEDLCNGRSGRVAIQDTQWTAPALRETDSGGGYGCSDNLGALREIPKKKTMSSLQAEQSKSHGEKARAHRSSTRTEDMRGFLF